MGWWLTDWNTWRPQWIWCIFHSLNRKSMHLCLASIEAEIRYFCFISKQLLSSTSIDILFVNSFYRLYWYSNMRWVRASKHSILMILQYKEYASRNHSDPITAWLYYLVYFSNPDQILKQSRWSISWQLWLNSSFIVASTFSHSRHPQAGPQRLPELWHSQYFLRQWLFWHLHFVPFWLVRIRKSCSLLPQLRH